MIPKIRLSVDLPLGLFHFFTYSPKMTSDPVPQLQIRIYMQDNRAVLRRHF